MHIHHFSAIVERADVRHKNLQGSKKTRREMDRCQPHIRPFAWISQVTASSWSSPGSPLTSCSTDGVGHARHPHWLLLISESTLASRVLTVDFGQIWDFSDILSLTAEILKTTWSSFIRCLCFSSNFQMIFFASKKCMSNKDTLIVRFLKTPFQFFVSWRTPARSVLLVEGNIP
jgi:hypothetical protein